MKVLTDTHTLVWALSDPDLLGPNARAALEQHPFSASVVNLWELVLKARKPGALVADPLPWWDKYVIRTRTTALAVRTAHIRALAVLPEIHNDPFDRLLVAQALVEKCTIATRDGRLVRYGIEIVW